MNYSKSGNKYIVRIDKGEEVLEQIKNICKQNSIKSGSISAIGATDRLKIGLFNTMDKKYISKELTGAFEITSLIGNISSMNDEVYLHTHITVSDETMNVQGGHLNYCYISATCEIIIYQFDIVTDRKFDENIGLNLYSF